MLSQLDEGIDKLNTALIFEKKRLINKSNKICQNFDTIEKPDTLVKINSCTSYECILENLNKNKNKKQMINKHLFSPTTECLNIRFNVYDQLSKCKIEVKPNLTNRQLYEMKSFIVKRPFSVVQCDKNIGLAVINNELLHSLCLSHLSDTNTYLKLNINPIEESIIEIKSIIHRNYYHLWR